MKNLNVTYALLPFLLIIIFVMGVSSYMGITQLQNMHIDNGITSQKNITVLSKEFTNRQYVITDTDNVSYITSEQNELRMTTGKNYTISVSTINNQTGYWIASSTEIRQPNARK